MQQTGNVCEWCADWHGSDYYGKSPAKDPVGPAGGWRRVCRGGSWSALDVSGFRGADRGAKDPVCHYDYLGFRLVRNSPSVAEAGENRS